MISAAYAVNGYTHTKAAANDPLELVIMLYDGANDYLNKTIFFMNQGKASQKVFYISKTIAIIGELLSSLNMEAGGDIARNLEDLYTYMMNELIIANVNNDADKVARVNSLLKELKSAWKQIKQP